MCPLNSNGEASTIGEASGVSEGAITGAASIVGVKAAVDEIGVGATWGAQPVITSSAITVNKLRERLVNILISFWPGEIAFSSRAGRVILRCQHFYASPSRHHLLLIRN